MPPPNPVGLLPCFGEHRDLGCLWPSPVGQLPYLAAAAIHIPAAAATR